MAASLNLISVLNQKPQAWAKISGSPEYPNISGTVYFYPTRHGVLITVEVSGLPEASDPCENRIFALHIHNGFLCTGNKTDPFANAMTHYDPGSHPHPCHAGDLPPLFSNHGYAFQAVLSNRFSIREVIHRTIIVHSGPDDFTTQPAGNAGQKIACGKIEAFCC